MASIGYPTVVSEPSSNCERLAARPLDEGGTPVEMWTEWGRHFPPLNIEHCPALLLVAAHPDDETLGFGATASVHYERIYPATVNTVRESLFAAEVAESIVGKDHVVRDMEPSMGAEDFSFMLQVKPGAYLRIGQGGENNCFLHNSRYDFNDDILPLGAALLASLVESGMPPQN